MFFLHARHSFISHLKTISDKDFILQLKTTFGAKVNTQCYQCLFRKLGFIAVELYLDMFSKAFTAKYLELANL